MADQTAKPIFEVKFDAAGKAVGKMRNEVTLVARQPFQTTNMLATDEGAFQGGEETAPTPLEYFLTGLVGCLMTQIRVFAKRMKVQIDDLEVTCQAHWSAHKDEVGPYQGRPEGFQINVRVETPEGRARIEELVGAARRGCFVEATLAQANTIEHSIDVVGETSASA
ncbi:Uncharacterized OsmC-related protein [Tranquillimonas rosea]|uniref:Uncharacterized OsmC-related protein n=1 Tax=Tranquillimonas rosea TaxID=641238 RepID=A0A1H9WAY4_9RHOB|nr:OsmC family protein [Tranquillimonas rosea]SES30984.1 Uncharacterized OsmC-related protein [Tranquillimonas rosea]